MATINFKGKEIVRNHHLTIPYHELVPDVKKSLTKKISLNDNLIVHGDNLLVLKALLPTYAGRIKCIYIDPPYNTGNEKWSYNDNVNSPMMKDWLGKVVDKDDLTRHDKWLCLMMPRLKLLKELLCDDGVIFVSIDDSEVSALRQLMNEIFFEDNFIGQIVWRKRPNPPNDSKFIGRIHEYILGYRKTDAIQNFEKLERFDFSAYSNQDDDPRGDWKTSPLVLTETQARPNLTYQIVSPSGKKFKHPHGWRIEKKLFDQLNVNNEIYWGEKGDSFPMRKRYLSEDEGMLFNSIALNFGTTITARKEIKNIFDALVFETPKPSKLISALVELSTNEDSIILDSFAGSGTTAHAVLALNVENKGNRKFILVQLPEEIEKDKPAYKMGFREVIDVTLERVRRLITGIKGAKDENLQKGFGGSFSYFELGKPIDTERILKGKNLPSFLEMARYIFYTATGEEFNEKKIDEKSGFIGESNEYKIYLFYRPDLEYLKTTALTLERAEALGKFVGKKRLIFAPAKYLDHEHLERLHIEFAQLPFEIYQR